MRALLFNEYGGLDVLHFEDGLPVPSPATGEVQVKVAGSGVNPIDQKIRSGAMKAFFPATFPQIVSREFSGTVTELGEGVTQFAVGDEVWGIERRGTTAEYIVCSVDAMGLKASSMDLPDASAVPVAGLTAWQALFDHADLQPGQRILIHAASGGVGHIAVQLAKWKGAYVYGTSSPDNFHLLSELGVDRAIDYKTEKAEEVAAGVDVVLHLLPGDQLPKSIAALKPGGIVVSTTGPVAADLLSDGKRGASFSMTPSRSNLDQLSALIEDVKVRPVVYVLPFKDAIEAQRLNEEGHVRGKLAVRIP